MIRCQVLMTFMLLAITLVGTVHFNKQPLGDKWKMVLTSCPNAISSLTNKQFDVTVPSTIHLNLEKYNQIPNPYFGDNLKGLAVLSECNVKFFRTITVLQQLKYYAKATLTFEGIDTYSTIYLNDAKLGSTQNAFLKYQYQVKDKLRVGNNLLVVEIKSPKPVDAAGQLKDRMPFDYAHTRKACYQYSWDWAPYMNTLGIWLPVTLTYYNQAKIGYVWIRNEKLTERQAVLDVVVALDEVGDEEDLTGRGLQCKILRKDNGQEFHIGLVSKYTSTKIVINQPQLWWPNGIGKPHLYQLQFFLMKESYMLDYRRHVYGLRTVQHKSDGTNFQIIVNGYPIYCKGANYVPPDMMYPRLINKQFNAPKSIQSLLDDAVQSNFNMLRVWGGGQYQSNEFYEMASKKGIMIFQDFMFSDSIYPGSDEFVMNVRREVVYQVRRLRNYPAIVMWSGNNQILQGIQSWGWGQPRYRQNYKKVFGKLIPDILNVQCNYLPYIQSSPSRGVGNGGFGQGGDVHYWGVWAAGSPFESYNNAIGGFNSEFGTQSLPVWDTIKQFVAQSDWHYESDKFAYHERHSSKFNTLKNYISKYSRNSLNFQMEAYNSGLVQAWAIELAIRAQRISKPKSFGTLYWQFNDAWPSISWSSIDYYGRWKPLQFVAKNLYRDVILFFSPEDRKFIAINDKLFVVKANYAIEVVSFKGDLLFSESGSIELKPNEKRSLFFLGANFVSGVENKCVVQTMIVFGDHQDNKTVVHTFLKPLKDLDLQPAELKVRYEYNTNEIVLQSLYVIKNLYISNTEGYVKFSDNYFDLLPNKIKKVTVLNNPQSLQELKKTMFFKSYRQIFDPRPLQVRIQN